jgi:hypothetical protein
MVCIIERRIFRWRLHRRRSHFRHLPLPAKLLICPFPDRLHHSNEFRRVSIRCRSRSYFTTYGRSVGISWCRADSQTCDQTLLPVGMFCLKLAVLFLWGALSNERTRLQFEVQSLNGPNCAKPVTILYRLIWDSPTWTARFPYLYSQSQESLYGWQSVSQSVCLGVEPTLWTFDQILLPFQVFEICCLVSVGRPLYREAGSVLCKSQSSHLWNSVAQLYPRALGSLYVASCDSQGYGGDILTSSTRNSTR